MAPLVDSASPERSPARLTPRKRRRVAAYSYQAVGDAGLSSCESVEAFSGGSDDEWAPDDASSGGGDSDSEDNGDTASDSDEDDAEDCKDGVMDGASGLKQKNGDALVPTMGHTPELFCAICEREFSFKHALMRHLNRRHKSDERPFECATCRLAFRSKKELNAHANDHKELKGVEHKCKGCNRLFATRHERRQHFRKAHFFTCPFRTCGDRFAEQLAWTRHIRRYHKAVKGVRFDCTECRQEFQTRHELEWHQYQQGHDAFACTHPGCGKKYSKREHLTRHVAAAHSSASKEKPFQCTLCQARFAYKHGLVRHTNRSHLNQDRPYQCSVCQLAFKKKSLLQAHSYVHTGVLPFECDVCSQRFAKRFLLVRHQRSHGGSAPARTQVHVCDVSGCSAVLFSTEEKREHMDQEHQEQTATSSQPVEEKAAYASGASEERKRAPSITDASSSAEAPKGSEADPSPSPSVPQLVCQVCNHAFGRQSSLRNHLRTHFEAVDERKLFPCPVAGCDKTYTRTSNVMAHYNAVHDARKSQRFVCPYEGCEGRFGRKSILTNHIAKIHKPSSTIKAETPTKTRSVRYRTSKGILERALGVVGESKDRVMID